MAEALFEEAGASLMTPLGLISGDVLTYLEERGATAVRRIVRDLEWPAQMVTMAIGALIREGLVRAVQHDLEVIIEAVAERPVVAQDEAFVCG